MQGRLAALALLLAVVLASPARAADDAERLTAALRENPVHVDPRAEERLSPRAASQLRLRIAKRDLGRIRIAVLAEAVKRRAGGLEPLANAIAARLQRPGTLLLVSGRDWWLNTSYAPGRVIASVQKAANGNDGLRRQLLSAVNAIALADPGPAADPHDAGGSVPATGSTPPTSTGAPTITIPGLREVGEGAKTGLILFGGACLAAVLALVSWLVVRALRRRREAGEVLADALADARTEHVAVGEELTDLDLDEEMPGADTAGKESYARALDLYDRAGQALERADSPRRARRATQLVAAARTECDRAKTLLTQAGPGARR